MRAYTEHMRSLLANRRGILPLVFSLLLSLQVTGTHLHLCLDGLAPPIQVHMVDVPASHGPMDHALQHVDREIPLATTAGLRDQSKPLDLGPPPISTVRPYAQLTLFVVVVPFRSALSHFSFDSYELLPPNRGPPLTARA